MRHAGAVRASSLLGAAQQRRDDDEQDQAHQHAGHDDAAGPGVHPSRIGGSATRREPTVVGLGRSCAASTGGRGLRRLGGRIAGATGRVAEPAARPERRRAAGWSAPRAGGRPRVAAAFAPRPAAARAGHDRPDPPPGPGRRRPGRRADPGRPRGPPGGRTRTGRPRRRHLAAARGAAGRSRVVVHRVRTPAVPPGLLAPAGPAGPDRGGPDGRLVRRGPAAEVAGLRTWLSDLEAWTRAAEEAGRPSPDVVVVARA